MREIAANHTDHKISNIAQDLEINQMIERLSWVRLPDEACLPSPELNVPENLTMESYYPLLNGKIANANNEPQQGEHAPDGMPGNSTAGSGGDTPADDGSSDGDGDGDNGKASDGNQQSDGDSDEHNGSGSSSDTGTGSMCGSDKSEEISSEADRAGIERSTPSDAAEAKQAVVDNVKASLNYGDSSGDQVFDNMLLHAMEPPKVDWRDEFKHTISHVYSMQSYKKTYYSYNRVNRRGSAFMRDVVFPGMVGSDPIVMVAVDTSGSMSKGELRNAINELGGILKTISHGSKGGIGFFCVDTKMKDVQMVSDPEELDITGGGGTDMAPAFAYVDGLRNSKRPDVFVLATDAGFDWNKTLDNWPKNMKVVLLITDEGGMKEVPSSVYALADVIDIA
jgi:predicted metal-dependent peptidase